MSLRNSKVRVFDNWLVGRLFIPLALGIGLSVDESSRVASLVGLKMVLNEVFAQNEMGRLAREGLLSPRARLLCTHALCGFSSLGALGVQLGVFAALVPERLSDCARVAGRALIAGSIACFLTACTAGGRDSSAPPITPSVDDPEPALKEGVPVDKVDATEAQRETLDSEGMSVTSATLKRVRDEVSESGKTSTVNSEEPPAKTPQGLWCRLKMRPNIHSN
ncbi:hypothetical protein MRX96_022421 [Rhipicephalus microplus]